MSEQLSINPFTGETLKSFQSHSKEEVKAILSASQETFISWRETSFQNKSELMCKLASLLRNESEQLAKLISLEMGKIFSESKAEIEKCAWVCEFYADNAEEFLQADKIDLPDGKKAKVIHQPLGCILAIMPWNFPFWQVFRFAAPTLMAGNTGLLKHASNVPQCAMAIEDLFKKAGFPEGVFRTLIISGKDASQMIKDKRIKAVSLTGSEKAGSSVASIAGSEIKKSLLELGGSDAFIVLKDADLELAVSNAIKSRMINFGQSCIAAKRFIIEDSIFEEFKERLIAGINELKQGDPFEEGVDFGCMARPDLAQELGEQVEESIKLGAKVVLGGKKPEEGSAKFEPTILTDIPPYAPAAKDELFGPVFSLFKVKDKDEAIEIANQSDFGLGGSVWSTDHDLALEVAEKVETGAMFINSLVASNPQIPFGGVKKSGYGRELGKNGILEFVNAKSVYLG
ncbi:NAD-dependent succinate-semialdehyde dehydrogenase [Algoriphagus sediminis]|uniref:NAD-dependent succinate-semialdehyde dehydrogenase n=1 Tax=Algoriphagus sediminis TaxID=3057113 RepID=A0ABT7YGS9_9BACT|nr:NAD-dependent succinate-semialdehyde dehydrogenase [Algoriphagus sediminis]MDN3205716.1 NAD-dependent succinate-semialdehyde dehydrogenase [Algoriphagus sediminis]